MAWSGGTELFEDVITAAQKAIPDADLRQDFYIEMIEAFEREGWDEQNDCRGLDAAFDEALTALHPEFTEDEDEDDEDDQLH